MFAKISVSMLQPDLVIMDEFQRFKYLIHQMRIAIGILSESFQTIKTLYCFYLQLHINFTPLWMKSMKLSG